MIHRLQRNGFQWEDEPFEVLLERYPKCRAALRWWCNEWGEKSRFNISWSAGLKEFMILNPPKMLISSVCCSKAKKEPAHDEQELSYDLICTGVRKSEGGARAERYSSCFDQKTTGPDYYRPIFWLSDADKESYTKRFGIVRSDCYEEWGMDRTGCAGCPFGKRFEKELELVQQYEPKRYKAMISVFGESYEYTRKFLKFREQMNAEKSRRNETDAGQTKMEGF